MDSCWRCNREFDGDSFSDGMRECEPCHLKQSIELLQKDLQKCLLKLEDMDPYICELQEKTVRAESSAEVAGILRETSEKKAKNLQTELDSEREGLISWMRSRRAQQEQLFKMPYISKDTKLLVEIEVGLIDKYLAIIKKGGHRNNNPMVSDPDPKEFKSLRTMEREHILSQVKSSLGRVNRKEREATPGTLDHTMWVGQGTALALIIEDLQKMS